MKYKCWWIFFHDWDKWILYEKATIGVIYGKKLAVELRQQRDCKKCGRTQDRRVSDGMAVPKGE